MSTLESRPKVGLTLSGGGARGLAHIGVIKALEEANVPIHIVTGTSMGGVIAGLYCGGLSVDTLESIALQLSKPSRWMKLIDLSDTRRGLLQGDNVKEFLEELLNEDLQIEELDIRLALAAVDLRTSREVCLNSGSLIDSMMATASLPGLFDPIIINDQVLVDGGVLNNLPVDLAQKSGADIVIAVDVNYHYDVEIPWDERNVVSKLNTLLPSMFFDIYQVEMIMISALTEQKLEDYTPDFLVRPKIPYDINIFTGFSCADEIIQTGVDEANLYIPQILDRLQLSSG